MGYNKQIGVANAEHRRKRAAMPASKRFAIDTLQYVVIFGVSLLLWFLQLYPAWVMAKSFFR
jgi:hypothetical protein